MRAAWITNAEALRARMVNPAQLQAPSPQAEMPPYMESFLAHLRLLVGVPFDYLLADFAAVAGGIDSLFLYRPRLDRPPGRWSDLCWQSRHPRAVAPSGTWCMRAAAA